MIPSIISHERVCYATGQNIVLRTKIRSKSDDEFSVKCVDSDISLVRLYSNIGSLILLLLF